MLEAEAWHETVYPIRQVLHRNHRGKVDIGLVFCSFSQGLAALRQIRIPGELRAASEQRRYPGGVNIARRLKKC